MSVTKWDVWKYRRMSKEVWQEPPPRSAPCSHCERLNGEKWKPAFPFPVILPPCSKMATRSSVLRKMKKGLERKPFGDLEDLPQGGSENGRDSRPRKEYLPITQPYNNPSYGLEGRQWSISSAETDGFSPHKATVRDSILSPPHCHWPLWPTQARKECQSLLRPNSQPL